MIQHKEIGRPLGRQSFGYGVSKGKLQKQINFIIELSYYIKENNGCFNKKKGWNRNRTKTFSNAVVKRVVSRFKKRAIIGRP